VSPPTRSWDSSSRFPPGCPRLSPDWSTGGGYLTFGDHGRGTDNRCWSPIVTDLASAHPQAAVLGAGVVVAEDQHRPVGQGTELVEPVELGGGEPATEGCATCRPVGGDQRRPACLTPTTARTTARVPRAQEPRGRPRQRAAMPARWRQRSPPAPRARAHRQQVVTLVRRERLDRQDGRRRRVVRRHQRLDRQDGRRRGLARRGDQRESPRPGRLEAAVRARSPPQRGTLPCLRFGRSSRFDRSISRLRMSTARVSAGWMTSST